YTRSARYTRHGPFVPLGRETRASATVQEWLAGTVRTQRCRTFRGSPTPALQPGTRAAEPARLGRRPPSSQPIVPRLRSVGLHWAARGAALHRGHCDRRTISPAPATLWRRDCGPT